MKKMVIFHQPEVDLAAWLAAHGAAHGCAGGWVSGSTQPRTQALARRAFGTSKRHSSGPTLVIPMVIPMVIHG